MACMIIIALASASLLGVGWQGRPPSLTFPAMTGTVGIFPSGGFRRCYFFVYFICNLHALEHLTYLLVGLPINTTYLWIGLLCPAVRNSV